MKAISDKQVDLVFGIPVYFNAAIEEFHAERDGVTYRGTRLSDVKRDLEADRPVVLDEPVIYASGDSEMVLTNIIRITAHGSLMTGKRAGYGVSPYPEGKEIYPRNEHNSSIYKKHKTMRDRGWSLIYQADSMSRELEPFPKGYWDKKAKDARLPK